MKLKQKLTIFLQVAIILVAFSPFQSASAAGQITTRSVTLGNANFGATTTYQFTFTPPTATAVKGFQVLACTTAFNTCVNPGGTFSFSGAANASTPTVVSGTGFGATIANWVKDGTNSTSFDTRYSFAANATATSGAQSFTVPTVVSLSTATPVYLRMYTYSNSTTAAWDQVGGNAGVLDTGNVVAVASQAITISGTVQEQLTFCVYTGASCGTGTTVTLGASGILSTTTSTNISKFDLSTNAANSVSITYAATTFSNGSQTIPASGAQTHTAITPATGVESIALSLTAVTSTLVAANGYGSYAIRTDGVADQIATATSTAGAVGTLTYEATISSITKPGAYNATFRYQAIATF